MNIRIRIFSDFASHELCKQKFESCNLTFAADYGMYKKYYINDYSTDLYTHAILLNCYMPDPQLLPPKENVIGLAFEPLTFLGLTSVFVEYAEKYIGKYFIGDKPHIIANSITFIEHTAYLWHFAPKMRVINQVKDFARPISFVLSDKQCTEGHKYRHALARIIIEADLPIDIYGRGSELCRSYATNRPCKNVRILGNFAEDETVYAPYMFSICIENVISNQYFSEKVISPMMYSCVPIYLGCRNFNNYAEHYLELTGSIPEDINTLITILSSSAEYYTDCCTEKNMRLSDLISDLPNIF